MHRIRIFNFSYVLSAIVSHDLGLFLLAPTFLSSVSSSDIPHPCCFHACDIPTVYAKSSLVFRSIATPSTIQNIYDFVN